MNKARTALALFFASAAIAIGAGEAGTVTFIDPLGGKNFGVIATAIINELVKLAVPILGIMVIWGGVQLMTAAGNEQKISSGRKTLTWAAVGFAVIISWELINELISDVLKG